MSGDGDGIAERRREEGRHLLLGEDLCGLVSGRAGGDAASRTEYGGFEMIQAALETGEELHLGGKMGVMGVPDGIQRIGLLLRDLYVVFLASEPRLNIVAAMSRAHTVASNWYLRAAHAVHPGSLDPTSSLIF